MSDIVRCSDQWGRTIVLSGDRWSGKILLDHPEMIGNEDCIEKTLTEPYCVYFDKERKDVEVFYRPFVLPPPFQQSWLKVCVRFRAKFLGAGNEGEVLTAFSTDRVHPDEEEKWPCQSK
jgi:hypothetical protein